MRRADLSSNHQRNTDTFAVDRQASRQTDSEHIQMQASPATTDTIFSQYSQRIVNSACKKIMCIQLFPIPNTEPVLYTSAQTVIFFISLKSRYLTYKYV